MIDAGRLSRSLASVALMSAAAGVALAVSTLTLFRSRRIAARMAALTARTILRLYGIRLVMHGRRLIPEGQVVYISNHTSTIDLFALTALDLPDTRFFLSGFLRWYGPLGVMAMLMGTFFTVPQPFQAERRRRFAAAARTLRATGESVYLSPEGGRITSGGIGHFNKGAFHLAASLGAPVVPLYLAIPRASDPGQGYDARPGRVDVHVMPAIDTWGWRVEDAATHAARVRLMFVAWHRRVSSRESQPVASPVPAVNAFPA
jgi:1-acyl-sn-glycerol-3-phosphate acyltransferase